MDHHRQSLYELPERLVIRNSTSITQSEWQTYQDQQQQQLQLPVKPEVQQQQYIVAPQADNPYAAAELPNGWTQNHFANYEFNDLLAEYQNFQTQQQQLGGHSEFKFHKKIQFSKVQNQLF